VRTKGKLLASLLRGWTMMGYVVMFEGTEFVFAFSSIPSTMGSGI